ncbi:hypothetical protein NCS56_01549200 [Fusarium sp. Ph1]|nr:hypothetical protein NCS56_01549200 [Fusarium sp. Ph1]
MSKLENEQTLVRQNCDLCAKAGQKYHDLAMANHPGVLFLLITLDPIRRKTTGVNRTTLTATFEHIPGIDELQKRIPYISMMQKYDDAAKKFLEMLESFWIGWLHNIKPTSNSCTAVQYLFANGFLAHPSLGVAPETLVMVKDIGGVERQLDARLLREAVICARDTSGHMRYIRVGMWTDLCTGLLGNRGAGVQTQPPFETQVQPPFGTQVQPSSGVQSQPPFGVQVQPPFGVQVQPPFGVQVQPPFGTEVQLSSGVQVPLPFGAQVQPTYVDCPAGEMPSRFMFSGQDFFNQ